MTIAAAYGTSQGHTHEIKFKDLVISHPWTRSSPGSGDVMAGFMKITNNGREDDRLVSATIEFAPVVQLHEMKLEGDVMKMAELPNGIPVPVGVTVELKPGSLHVMFMEITSAPMVGQEVKGTLTFEKAGTVEVE